MTVLFGASQSGIGIVRDQQIGFLQRMARASTHPGWTLSGRVLADVLRLLLQAIIVALLGVALGAHLRVDIFGVVLGAVGLVLFAVAYASLSCWIALKTRAQESMAVFVHLVNMPLLFTSTALVPSRQMPAWLESIARFNPLSLVADMLRSALLLERTPSVSALLPLLALAVVIFLLALYEMRYAADE
jgi:ABC-2 type transport system permease protein